MWFVSLFGMWDACETVTTFKKDLTDQLMSEQVARDIRMLKSKLPGEILVEAWFW